MSNKKTAILIGSTEFPESVKELNPLPFSEGDISNLERILSNTSIGGAEVLRLIDLPHWKISTNVNKIFRDACRDDQVIFFYSGYAVIPKNNPQLYLATVDTNLNLLPTTALRAGNFANLLCGTQCRRISIVLDLYYVNTINNIYLVKSISDFFENLKSSITEGYSISLIAAYQDLNQKNYESNLVKTIVGGIESGDADANQDGSITTEELSDYINKIFTSNGNNEFFCIQHGPQNSFIFSKSTSRFVTNAIIRKIKKKLITIPNNHEINRTIIQNALEILKRDHNDIEKNHQSAFKLLKEWSDDKILEKDFLNQWYQYEGTELPDTEIPRQSTELRERWDIVRKFRGPMQDLICPSYILDRNFQFLDWNPMFDELIAKPLGLLRGRHVEEFILELENKIEVIYRSNRIFQSGKFPLVDIEPLALVTKKYGLINFKKIASKIPNDKNIDLWSVNLNIINAEHETLMWRDLRKRIKKDLNWSLYAKAYDHMLLNFDSYNELVTRIVSKLGDAKNVVDLASGTGNNTIELLKNDQDRTVWALEYNQEMLEYMWDKISQLDSNATNNVNIVKGDLILSLREFDENAFDGAVMTNALYAMEDRAYCLREIYRVLKPGSFLVLSTSTQDTDIDYLFEKIRENLDQKGLLNAEMEKTVYSAYERHFDMLDSILHDSHEEVINYATAAGFQIEEVEKNAYEGAVTIIKAKKRETVKFNESDRKELNNEVILPKTEITRVFISYAHENEEWCKALKKYLKPITLDGNIEVWSDHDIEYGDHWRNKIQSNLENTNIAILLISTDFLNSEFIINSELPCLLHEANNRGLLIIPIILEKCPYDIITFKADDPDRGPYEFKLSDLQSVGCTTNTMDKLKKHEQNELFYDIANKIKTQSDA